MADTNEENAVKEKKPQTNRWLIARQVWVAVGPFLSTIAVGITFGYSSILLPQLKSTADQSGSSNRSIAEEDAYSWTKGSILVDNRDVESWIAASGTLLTTPGCWLSGLFMDVFGRKKSQIITILIIIAGWLAIALAPNLIVLIAGRSVCGLCAGLQGPLGVVYTSETSDPRLRGFLAACLGLALSLGMLISHVLGIWLDWRLVAYLSTLFPIVGLFFCLLAPESPTWFLKRNRPESARKAWLFLRGETAEEEYEAMRANNTTMDEDQVDEASHGANRPWWRSSSFLKPLLIMNVYFATVHFSGMNMLAFYCIELVQNVSGTESTEEEAYWATLVLDVVRVAASLISCSITKFCKRRLLTGISGVGSSACLLGLGVVLLFGVGQPWLPVSLLLGYIFVVTIGIMPLSWLLCGELFPVTFRGLGSGLCTGFAFICSFIVVKTGPAMFQDIGAPGSFTIYGIITLCGTVFLHFFLPETKDKTLQEIEEGFKGSTKNETSPAGTEPA